MSRIPVSIKQSLNKKISDICPFSIAKNNSQNHCAHYVSHILGYDFSGITCKNFTYEDKQIPEKGATIRVDDIFSQSPVLDLLSNKPGSVSECLIFVTLASNVKKVGDKYVMGNHPKKHIGIFLDGNVWNYSNSRDLVVSESLVSFQAKFEATYQTAGTSVVFYYGKLP
jgi:hypothetical protein